MRKPNLLSNLRKNKKQSRKFTQQTSLSQLIAATGSGSTATVAREYRIQIFRSTLKFARAKTTLPGFC
jgi:hypothetical protein